MDAMLPPRMDVETAVRDVRRRTLAAYPGRLAKLVYLASLRDYNTGLYQHEGLSSRFSDDVTCQALAECHRGVFRDLLGAPLLEFASELQAYMESTGSPAGTFLAAWETLEPYRVLVPAGASRLGARLLASNFKVTLALLESHWKTFRQAKAAAWPLP